jgi:hypothetical protein
MTEHEQGGSPVITLPLLLIATLAAAYLLLALRQHSRARAWNSWRSTGFLLGCAVLAWGMLPQSLPFAEVTSASTCCSTFCWE